MSARRTLKDVLLLVVLIALAAAVVALLAALADLSNDMHFVVGLAGGAMAYFVWRDLRAS